MRSWLLILLLSVLIASLSAQSDTIGRPEVRRAFYPNGKLQSVVTYVNGRICGSYRSYNEAGHPIEVGTFVHNIWLGKYFFYYDDGRLQQNFTFNAQGKRDGLQRYYHRNGLLQYVSRLRNNVQQGYFLEFDSLGHLEETPVYYIDGRRTDTEVKGELNALLEIVRLENEVGIFRKPD